MFNSSLGSDCAGKCAYFINSQNMISQEQGLVDAGERIQNAWMFVTGFLERCTFSEESSITSFHRCHLGCLLHYSCMAFTFVDGICEFGWNITDVGGLRTAPAQVRVFLSTERFANFIRGMKSHRGNGIL